MAVLLKILFPFKAHYSEWRPMFAKLSIGSLSLRLLAGKVSALSLKSLLALFLLNCRDHAFIELWRYYLRYGLLYSWIATELLKKEINSDKKNCAIMKWWHISAILCTYGFFKELRPSEPFISPYLETFKNFTIKQISEEMFPVGTYCYLFLLIIVFFLTDFLRYKPILITGSASGIITWSLLIWGTTMREMQIVEFFYGFFLASEIAYYSYIYAEVNKKYYQKVTSHTRAAILLGKASAGLSSQFLVNLKINYLELNYFTVCSVGITVFLVFLLPSVPRSIYFHREETESEIMDQQKDFISSETVHKETINELQKTKLKFQKCNAAFSRLYEDFKHAFTNLYVLRWSTWWALATCGYLQAISYCQLLWQDINQEENSTLYHGYVEFTFAVTGAAVAFGAGYLNVPWSKWGEIFLGFLTISQGAFLFYSARLTSLYVAYGIFILFRDFYEAAITIATCEVAKFINQDSYALVFGINTFVALILQSIMTVIVLNTLGMDIKSQFLVYGSYHFVIGSAFLLYGILKIFIKYPKSTKKRGRIILKKKELIT